MSPWSVANVIWTWPIALMSPDIEAGSMALRFWIWYWSCVFITCSWLAVLMTSWAVWRAVLMFCKRLLWSTTDTCARADWRVGPKMARNAVRTKLMRMVCLLRIGMGRCARRCGQRPQQPPRVRGSEGSLRLGALAGSRRQSHREFADRRASTYRQKRGPSVRDRA